MFDERMFRKKKYFCSQTLKRTVELYNDNASVFIAKVKDNSKLLFEKETNSDWIGRVAYESYKVEDDKKEPEKLEALDIAF